MSRRAGATTPAPAVSTAIGAGRRGVLSKLMAAVRPEFRADVLVIDPHDPVFGGPPCRVSACERAARLHDLCEGHYQRWERHQRPEITEFAESTAATMRSHQVLQPCRAPACGNARNSNGLCIGHIRAWRRSGYAQIGTWLETLPLVDHSAPHGICRVGSCTLWATVKVPLCATHASRWRRYGRPGIDEFVATYADISLTRDCITLGQLAPQLRLEVQYVLQQRCDQRQAPIQPALVQRVVYTLARSGMASLLQLTDDLWHERIVTGPDVDRTIRPFLKYTRAQIENLCYGTGWEVEYPRDVWRLRNLGIDGSQATVRFDRIPQPWLKDLTKRWTRLRISSGLSANHVGSGVNAITRLAVFLDRRNIQRLDQLTRAVLEQYLADLSALGGTEHHGRLVSLLSLFLRDIRRHRWGPSLPADAMIHTEDFPRQPKKAAPGTGRTGDGPARAPRQPRLLGAC